MPRAFGNNFIIGLRRQTNGGKTTIKRIRKDYTCLWYTVSGALYCIAFEHIRKTSLWIKENQVSKINRYLKSKRMKEGKCMSSQEIISL